MFIHLWCRDFVTPKISVWRYMGASTNRGTPKWTTPISGVLYPTHPLITGRGPTLHQPIKKWKTLESLGLNSSNLLGLNSSTWGWRKFNLCPRVPESSEHRWSVELLEFSPSWERTDTWYIVPVSVYLSCLDTTSDTYFKFITPAQGTCNQKKHTLTHSYNVIQVM